MGILPNPLQNIKRKNWREKNRSVWESYSERTKQVDLVNQAFPLLQGVWNDLLHP